MSTHPITFLLALFSATAFLAGPWCGAAKAQDSTSESSEVTVVVELFTSQGCSSCPTADALLREYATRPGIIALTLPVDYWDYLGWRDTLASSSNSARQRMMAKARGDGLIFTPQVVVNGVKYLNGNKRAELEAAIVKAGGDVSRVPLTLASSGETVRVSVGAPTSDTVSVKLDAALMIGAVQRHVEVKVRGGENGGRMLSYANVVHELRRVGTWKGTALLVDVDRAGLMHKGADGCVALLQEGGKGRIISASLLSQC